MPEGAADVPGLDEDGTAAGGGRVHRYAPIADRVIRALEETNDVPTLIGVLAVAIADLEFDLRMHVARQHGDAGPEPERLDLPGR